MFQNIFHHISFKGENIILKFDISKLSCRLEKKLIMKMKKKNIKNVVLSKKISTKEELVKLFKSNDINIFDGRWLINYISYEIIDYIINKTRIKKEETEISILVNYLDDTAIENIKKLAQDFKRVNVVTNHIEKLKTIEKNIYDEYGTMITITNNKKKSLRNTKIILNVDFPEELINKYNIYDEAIIINLEGDVRINKKRFNGVSINNYEIENDYEYSNKFYTKDIYESKIYKKTTFLNIKEDIKKSNIKIKELVGNNGIIKFD